jgi:Tfp pilus assembly protein PilX
MPAPETVLRKTRPGEAGAVTILVTLMLLVLLTVWGVAMSKNALRETIISGTARQAAQVQNLSDSGLEWSIFWIMDDINKARPDPAVGTGAKALRDARDYLVANQLTGVATAAISTTDMTISAAGDNPTQRFEMSLTYMGNPRVKLTQSEIRASSISAASPNTVQLWSVRADGYMEYAGGPTFLNRKEAWFTVPPGSLK